MAVQILSQSYGPRKPLIECTADSLDDLVGLVCAEGSTATVGGTEYVLDRVNGWVEPGSGGGGSGGGSGVLVVGHTTADDVITLDKTWQEISDAVDAGMVVTCYGVLGCMCFVTGLNEYSVALVYFSVSPGGGVNPHGLTFNAANASGYPSYENIPG